MKSSARLLLALLGTASLASAQVVISNAGTGYAQNFDALANSGTPTWTDNTIILGWYAYATSDRDVGTAGSQGAGSPTTYAANDGSASSARLFSYGTGTNSDRALGAVAGATPGDYILGLRLTNNTGADITAFNLSYVGEQWRTASATPRSVSFSYQVGNPINLSNTSGTWTSVSAAGFTGPQASGTAGALDGNLGANQVSVSSGSVALTWANGQDLWLRWVIPNAGGTQGLAIDSLNLTFTSAIPEPSSFAALAGLAALGLVASRRRRA